MFPHSCQCERGREYSSSFGGGGSSGAAPTNKPAPYDPYGASSTFVPYSDIASRSLPSTTSAATGVPSVVLPQPLGLEQVHQFLLLRNAERKAEFDAYTDRLMKIGVLASTAPVLAYAGVGSLLGALGAESTGTAAALQGAATLGPLGIGIYQIRQGLAAGDQALIAEGLMNGLSAGAFLGEGLGAGPRAAVRGEAAILDTGLGSTIRQVRFSRGLSHAMKNHLTGRGPNSLRSLDPGGALSKWAAHVVKTATTGIGSSRVIAGGEVLEITAPMALETGGTTPVGVRLFRGAGEDTWTLTTILTHP